MNCSGPAEKAVWQAFWENLINGRLKTAGVFKKRRSLRSKNTERHARMQNMKICSRRYQKGILKKFLI